MMEDVRFSHTCPSSRWRSINIPFLPKKWTIAKESFDWMCVSISAIHWAMHYFCLPLLWVVMHQKNQPMFNNCRCAYFVSKSNKAWECMLLFSPFLNSLLLLKFIQYSLYFGAIHTLFANASVEPLYYSYIQLVT